MSGSLDFLDPKMLIRSPRYLWTSDNNLMSEQRGVFRVNCMDCLDRTNVVQVGTVFCMMI